MTAAMGEGEGEDEEGGGVSGGVGGLLFKNP